MELLYKTRELSKVEGKPKVYFTCHPADFEKAFPLLSDDILRHEDCAIWYDSQPDRMPTLEEIDGILDDMQLIVIAVTSVFLEETNRARNLELPYALEHHIPVLPIVLESGLGGKFSKTCAKIQIVTRFVTDSTATPYEDVLGTFLKSVLIGDELAAKVRAAFDAYVFLSYRKKDRKHAQRLMRMIHENKEYEDIAIWYDEYLVPGEGFNEAIVDAFKKSKIFAMAVTPHLEEEGNYVMRVEYPMARDREEEEKKKQEEDKDYKKDFEVVPVELYEDDKEWRIDPENLKKHEEFRYKEIKDLQDEHRRKEMDKQFIDALSRIAKKENDGSAEHRFFIGLAYLAGIDVEVNFEKARELIISAAKGEKPCLEASEKLVDMYYTGDGVQVNMEEALNWQNTLCSQLKVKYLEHHSPDEHLGYGTRYFKALLKLSDLQKEMHALEEEEKASEDEPAPKDSEAVDYMKEAEISLQKALNVTETLEEEVGKREVQRDKAVVNTRLGSLKAAKGEWQEAARYFRSAVVSYEQLAREIRTARALRDLSIAKERLGDAAKNMGDYTQALQYYMEVLDIRQNLAEKSDSLRTMRDLSSVYTKLGSVHKSYDEKLDQAKEYFEKALRLDKVIAKQDPNRQSKDDLAVSLTKQGDIFKAEKNYVEAADYYRQAREIFKSLLYDSRSQRANRHYAASCEKLASAGKRCMPRTEVVPLFEEAVQIRSDLIPKEDWLRNPKYSHELAISYYNFGLYLKDKVKIKKAQQIWKALEEKYSSYERFRRKADKALRS